jgi:hypothetical protein
MDIFFYLVGAVIGLGLLAVVAFPKRFVPEITKTTTVGPTYWGCYEGQPVEDTEEEKKIKVKTTPKKELVVAGSSTYAAGRGVSMRGM